MTFNITYEIKCYMGLYKLSLLIPTNFDINNIKFKFKITHSGTEIESKSFSEIMHIKIKDMNYTIGQVIYETYEMDKTLNDFKTMPRDLA
jgi:hypothetical protein